MCVYAHACWHSVRVEGRKQLKRLFSLPTMWAQAWTQLGRLGGKCLYPRQASLKHHMVLLPQPPAWWGCRCEPPPPQINSLISIFPLFFQQKYFFTVKDCSVFICLFVYPPYRFINWMDVFWVPSTVFLAGGILGNKVDKDAPLIFQVGGGKIRCWRRIDTCERVGVLDTRPSWSTK